MSSDKLFSPIKNPIKKTSDVKRVRSLMAINVGCKIRDRASIPTVCQITDAELGKSLANINHSLKNGGLLPRQATRY